MTPAGAALLAVAVAMALPSNVGADLLGNALGSPLTGIPAKMADAAFMSLAAQASITFVNNKGNIGKTLSDLAKSDIAKATIATALTAGVLEKIGALDSIKPLKNSDAFTSKLTLNLVNAGGRALTNAAINGGDLTEAFKGALLGGLVDTLHGEVASQIKGLESSYIAHKFAHAMAGCVAGAAAGGTCQDGAIGAAVGEMVADLMPPANGLVYSDAEKTKVLAYSKLVAGGVSAYAGGDAQTAITTAETAVENNAFLPLLLGAAWLADKVWTAYEVAQDVAAVRDGQKTVDQLVQEKGEEYVAAVVMGNIGRYGIKAAKVGGKWGQSKDNTFSNIVESRGSYTPNAGAAGNMGAFLKSPGFGSDLGKASQKTHKIIDGQTVYTAKEAVGNHIRAGDQFYLDGQHKNHIEVFGPDNNVRYVINLDGSINTSKTEAARNQKRTIRKS